MREPESRPVDGEAQTPTTTPTQTLATTPDSTFSGRRPVRMRTVVVGIVLLAVAVLTFLRITTTVDFQLGNVLLALMIGCGVLLIVGASRRE